MSTLIDLRFGVIAEQLVENGYQPVPLHYGQKRPSVDAWQNYKLQAEDLKRFAKCGVGLLCGGIVAIDIDVRDAKLATELEQLAEEAFGLAPRRIGEPPKVARIYQAAASFPKVQTRGYRLPGDGPEDKAHKVEILAAGQQLACFNLHPGTGKPYAWNGAGDPLKVPIGMLPTVTELEAHQFIAQAEAILARHGKPVGRLTESDDSRHESSEKQAAAEPQLLRSALAAIPNADLEWDDWIRVMLAVKGALGDLGLKDFLTWSAKSAKDVPEDSAREYRSAKPTRIGAGSIYHIATHCGWTRPVHKAEEAWDPNVPPMGEEGGDTARPGIELRHIADIVAERREPLWLKGLHKVLERNVLAVLAGSRNTFKSFIAHHWAMTAAINGEAVVILSAEGAGLDRRTDAWMRTHAPAKSLRDLQMVALERAVNLTVPRTIEVLREAIDAAGIIPALIVIDTYSKYAPGLDENDNSEVAAYLSALTAGLRHHYKAAILLVAHAGHSDAKRPRGASVLMANPDAEYIVERSAPTAMSATVTRERFKDSASLAPLAYAAEVIDLGRRDAYGEPVTSLVMRDAEPGSVRPEAKDDLLKGKAQRQLLAALRANSTEGLAVWTLADMREIGRKAGLGKATARSAVEALTFLRAYLTPTVGGWRLTDE